MPCCDCGNCRDYKARAERAEAERDAALAKLAEAQEDTARLDALLSSEIVMARTQDGHFLLHKKDHPPYSWKRLCIVDRAAIDAARGSDK